MCVNIFMHTCKYTRMDFFKYKYTYTRPNRRHRGDAYYCFNRI